jgi:hypothetical protein
MEINAVIIRADGTHEDLGTIASWHRNPLKRWWYTARRYFTSNNYSFIRKDTK